MGLKIPFLSVRPKVGVVGVENEMVFRTGVMSLLYQPRSKHLGAVGYSILCHATVGSRLPTSHQGRRAPHPSGFGRFTTSAAVFLSYTDDKPSLQLARYRLRTSKGGARRGSLGSDTPSSNNPLPSSLFGVDRLPPTRTALAHGLKDPGYLFRIGDQLLSLDLFTHRVRTLTVGREGCVTIKTPGSPGVVDGLRVRGSGGRPSVGEVETPDSSPVAH